MTKLTWNTKRNYEVGIDKGVFFPKNGPGEVWNGLISVTENAPDLQELTRYRDGVKVVNRKRPGSYQATIQTYTYPPSFPEHILVARRETEFGFSYRVNTAEGYKTHLIYNAKARVSSGGYTQSDTTPFSFDISTRPEPVPDAKPCAHLIIDTESAYSWTVEAFEDILYGNDSSDPRLPLPQEVFDIFEVNSILRVIDNGDGTFTVDGPDEVIRMIDETTFEITWSSVIFTDGTTYEIRSL